MSDAPSWLKEFFGAHNQITFQELEQGAAPGGPAAHLGPMLDRALSVRSPVLLPLVNPQGRLGFYLAVQQDRELVELQAMCRCFLGSSEVVPDFLPRRSAGNISEAALLQWASAGFIRVLVRPEAGSSTQRWIHDSLMGMATLLEERPPQRRPERRPMGRILRDFFTACGQGEVADAQTCIQELRVQGSLDSVNLALLELQALAAGRRWEELLQYPRLDLIVAGPIPASLTGPLLQALSHSLLGKALHGADLGRVREYCRPFQALFRTLPDLDPTLEMVWKTWAAGAASLGMVDHLGFLPSCVESGWVQDLRAWAGLTTLELPAAGVIPLVTPPHSLLERMLTAAPAKYPELLAELDALPDVERKALLDGPMVEALVEAVRRKVQATVMDWDHWFEFLAEVSTQDVPRLVRLAQMEAPEWPTTRFHELGILRVLRGSLLPEAQQALRDVTPVLLSWTRDRGIPGSADLWATLLTSLALDEVHSESDLVLATQLVEAFLDAGYTPMAYQELLVAAELLWDKVASVRTTRRILDLLEALSLSAPADGGAFQGFSQTVFQHCRNNRARLDGPILDFAWVLAKELFGEAAAVGLEPDAPGAVENHADLRGKVVAIYTLVESAARRAMAILQTRFPGLEVHHNADHVATPALLHLAETADYFIFASRCAKHQAYYPVAERLRARGKKLLFAEGKGTSSLIEALGREATI